MSCCGWVPLSDPAACSALWTLPDVGMLAHPASNSVAAKAAAATARTVYDALGWRMRPPDSGTASGHLGERVHPTGVGRLERYWRTVDGLTDGARDGQPELRAGARLTPCLEPAAVQVRSLQGDGQPESGAAGGPSPRGIGSPEPVEYQRGLAWLEADAIVAHRNRHCLVVRRHPDHDVAAIAVLNGVDDEVAQNALDPSRIHLGDAGHLWPDEPKRSAAALSQRLGALDHLGSDLTQVHLLGLEDRSTCIESTDLQQIGEQCLEPVELGLEKFR